MRTVNRLLRSGEAEGRYVRQMSGPGAYGIVRLRMEPGDGVTPIARISSMLPPSDPDMGSLRRVVEQIGEGMLDACFRARLFDARVTVLSARFHPVDSRPPDFRRAAALACDEIVLAAGTHAIDVEDRIYPRVRTVGAESSASVGAITLSLSPAASSRDLAPVWRAKHHDLQPDARRAVDEAVVRLARAPVPWVDVELELQRGFSSADAPFDGAAFERALSAVQEGPDSIVRHRSGPTLVWS